MATQLLKSKKPNASNGSNGRDHEARNGDIIINGSVHIPPWVIDHESFRRWALSEAYPEQGRFSWLADKLWVEIHSDLLHRLSDAAAAKMRDKAFKPIRNYETRFAKPRAKSPFTGDILIDELVRIPHWVRDVESFCRWARSDDYPAHGQFAFLAGKLWVDLSMETNFHSQIKTVITIVLGSIVLNEAMGFFYADNMLLTQRAIGLAQEPDAMFVSNARLEQGLAVLHEGDDSTEVSGSVDMALEVVSKSSVEKDTVDSVNLYAQAGVAEYWLVDSTIETPELAIMRLVGGKYVAARKRDGWVKSKVFGRSFRLTCKQNALGVSQFNLETK